MNFEQYQPLARRTLKELPYAQHIEHMSLGVIGEIGEFADALKKHAIYGKGVDSAGQPLAVADGGQLDLVNLHEEGGDAFWYIVGYLPELQVEHDVLQGAFDHGFDLGRLVGADPAAPLSAAQVIAQANAQIGLAVYNLTVPEFPGRTTVYSNMMVIGKNMGMLYGYFGLDLAASLERNIAKLAKRYGDKFSEYSALNRDLAGERKVLEAGGLIGGAGVKGDTSGDATAARPMGESMAEEESRSLAASQATQATSIGHVGSTQKK